MVFPESADKYYTLFLELSNFDIVPTEYLQNFIDESVGDADISEEKFEADEVLSESTIKAGYDSPNVVINSVFQIVLISSIMLLVIIMLILRYSCKNK